MAIEGLYRHPFQGVIKQTIKRPSSESINILKQAYSAFILDHLGKHSFLKGIKPLSVNMTMCGPAVTSLGPDLTVRRMAIDLASPGDVLVVANYGVQSYACFGDGTASRMRKKGMVGCVIDGATRDAGRLIEMQFPTFCLNHTPRNYHYPESPEYGAVNVPVACGSIIINPGDVIFGDYDGVVVIPFEEVENLADKVNENLLKEIMYRQEMKIYVPFDDEFHIKGELLKRGYNFID